MVFSFHEVYVGRVKKVYLYIFSVYLIILAGLRRGVGPDYGSYKGIYFWAYTYDYKDIIQKAFYITPSKAVDMEWGYLLINRLLMDVFQAPFFIVTLVIAILAIFFRNRFVLDNTFYPYTYFLLMFIPGFFVGESGQMRQNLGIYIVYFAIKYIKDRNIWMYLLCIHFAGSIHTVSYLFLPMYWVARVPINRIWMFVFIVLSILLSPFEIYRFFGGWLESIASESNLAIAANSYTEQTIERLNGGFGIPEVMVMVISFFLFTFDKPMRDKYPYYEYHRNYAIIGVCAYFIFRNNPIYSSRLAGAFIGFSYILIPNVMYVLTGFKKTLVHAFILFLVIFNLIVFGSFNNMNKGRFTIDKYENWLLP